MLLKMFLYLIKKQGEQSKFCQNVFKSLAYLSCCHRTAFDTNYWMIRTLFVIVILRNPQILEISSFYGHYKPTGGKMTLIFFKKNYKNRETSTTDCVELYAIRELNFCNPWFYLSDYVVFDL